MKSRLRYIAAVRFAIGITLGLLFVAFQWVPEALWIPITIAVVMSSGPYSGGVLNKAMQRAFATALGCGLGLGYVLLRGPHATATILIVGAVGGLVAGYFLSDARYKYVAIYTSVSLIIVISVPSDVEISFALWRIANIFIGGAIGLLVAILVLPESARRRFQLDFESTTARLDQLIGVQREGTFDSDDLLESEELIIAGIRSQKASLASARFESLNWRQAASELGGVVDQERELIRHLVGRTPSENFERLATISKDATSIFNRHSLN